MPLPSGTSISAANINSYLGRSASTSVEWNTQVRMLSNNNTSPDLNAARGQSAFNIQWQTGQSSDMKGSYSQTYPAFFSSEAFLIPNSPWRVIFSTSLNSAQTAWVYDLRIIGTNYTTAYRYNYSSASGATPTGYYVAGSPQSVMLDNGKFVIVCGLRNNASSWGFDYGLYFIVLTFNTDGTIATTNSYVYTGYNSNISYQAFLGYLITSWPRSSKCTKLGNKFMFAMSYIVPGTANYQDWLFTVDLSSSTLGLTIDQTGTVINSTNVSQAKNIPMLQSDGTVVCRPVYPYTSSNPGQGAIYNVLNSTGTTWSNGSRYTPSTMYYAVTPGNGGATYNVAIPTVSANTQGFWDSKGNFFAIYTTQNYSSQLQIASSPSAYYYTGSQAGMSVIKVNSSNTQKYEVQICLDSYLYATQTSSKSGTVTTYYPAYPFFSGHGIVAIETDNNDNTYILYTSLMSGTGAAQSATSTAVNPVTLGVFTTQQRVYNLTKLNSSGTEQWTVQIDTGSKTLGGNDQTAAVFQDALAEFNYTSAWSIICNDTINTVEVYLHIPPRDTGAAYYFAYLTTQRTFRSICLRMSDGATSTYAPTSASNISLLTKYTLTTTGTTVSQYSSANNGTTANILLKAPKISTTTAASAAGSTIFSVQNARATTSLSVYSSSAMFFQNPTALNLGTTVNTSPDSL